MYTAKSVDGFPAIQRNGWNVLRVWSRDWQFADEVCELLNESEGQQPKPLVTKSGNGSRQLIALSGQR